MPVENSEELAKAFSKKDRKARRIEKNIKKLDKRAKKLGKKQEKLDKTSLIFLICGGVGLVGGVALALTGIFMPKPKETELFYPIIPSKTTGEKIYSNLTGLELTDKSLVTAPTYCVQTPNGLDGARPHAGLDEAGVVFEAIAEAGITRFAAIYQNPTSAVIGPIRSLRLYYLQWDTPFDCTIVHAGGADDAIAAVRAGGYKDLTEDYTYMYRSNGGYRLWNNLFTNSTLLAQFSADHGYTTSNVKGFTRLTPDEAEKKRIDETVSEKLVITEPAAGNTATITPKVTDISFNFGSVGSFNAHYVYNAETNSYLRGYGSGEAHEIYDCPDGNLGEVSPESSCTLTQLSPKVVIAMMVEERKAADNYHENITAIGGGTAYIFQNGVAIKGTWTKASAADQIKFYDESGAEVSLVPGQTFISAVPNYGNVQY
ncbi:MAG: DUF3048 domain-containing protein [Candidatus Saccharibacteria bacterium]|nr:DUF3048 domain-containing protein [Candidatus Saccharibacteria bacterium]